MLTGAARGFDRRSRFASCSGPVRRACSPTWSRLLALVPVARRTANGVLFFGSRIGHAPAPIALPSSAAGAGAQFRGLRDDRAARAAAWHVWYRDRRPIARRRRRGACWIEQDGPPDASDRDPVARCSSRNLCDLRDTSPSVGLYFYFTWLPTYLIRELGFSLLGGGLFAALPFALAGIADLVGGWLTDWLARLRGLRVARCGLGFSSFMTSAVLVFASTVAPQPIVKAVLLAFALASADLAIGACWAVCLDVSPDHAGVITGFMNTFGNLGGLVGDRKSVV
jgi:hypothetical protein